MNACPLRQNKAETSFSSRELIILFTFSEEIKVPSDETPSKSKIKNANSRNGDYLTIRISMTWMANLRMTYTTDLKTRKWETRKNKKT